LEADIMYAAEKYAIIPLFHILCPLQLLLPWSAFFPRVHHHAPTQGKNERLAIRNVSHAEVQFCVKECKQTD